MPYTMADFRRDFVKEHFPKLTPEEQLDVLQALPPEKQREMLQALSPEKQREMLQALPPEEQREMLQALPPEERLAGLSEKQIRQYLDRLTAGREAPSRKPRRKR